MQIYKEFRFEAAHFLPSAPPSSPNSRVHGHSFRARIVIDGEPGPKTGYIFHFDELAAAKVEATRMIQQQRQQDILPGGGFIHWRQ